MPLTTELFMAVETALRAEDESHQRYTVRAVADHAGEFGSFEQLAMPLFAKLYNFAHWLTQDRSAAEDLVQETYMKALRGFSSFQQGTNFRAWMYKILRNTFLTTQTGLKAWATVSLNSDGDDDGANNRDRSGSCHGHGSWCAAGNCHGCSDTNCPDNAVRDRDGNAAFG